MGFFTGECSGSMQQICGVAYVPKCDFNRVAMQPCWGLTLKWMFSYEFALYFQGTSLWEHLQMDVFVFCKALLSLIVHFKGTFTYCYHCFVPDSQILNILQLLLVIWNSSYLCVSCVHNLKLFVSIIEYDSNKLCFHHLEWTKEASKTVALITSTVMGHMSILIRFGSSHLKTFG